MKFILPLGSEALSGIVELCNLRGCSTLSMVIVNKKIVLAAVTPEYLKVFDTQLDADCADVAIRLPVKILKPLLSLGVLMF